MIKKKVETLRIKYVKNLAKHLGTTPKELKQICAYITTCENNHNVPDKYYFEKERNIKGKNRKTATPIRRLRGILDRLNRLLQKIELPHYVHGGVPGHSIRSNAEPHLRKAVVISIDLEQHFPNVSPHKVYSMFLHQQMCSPDVARILTRLTTLNGELPQGSPTSTSISNLVTLHLSERLHGFTKARSAQCTQYVDDYTFSGSKELKNCKNKIAKIIMQEGFKINVLKTKVTPQNKEQIVCGIRVNKSYPDVPSEKIKEVRRQIDELNKNIINGQRILDNNLRSLEGKIHYIDQWNHGAGKHLENKLKRIKERAS